MSGVASAMAQASADVYNIGLGVQNQMFYDHFTKEEFRAKSDYFKFQKNTSGIPAQVSSAGSRFAGPTYSEQLKSLSEQATGAINQIGAGLQEHVNDVQQWSQQNQTTIGNGWSIGHSLGGLLGGIIGAGIGWSKAGATPEKNLSFTPVNVEQNTGFQGGNMVDPNTAGSHNYIQQTENHINAGLGYYVDTGKDPRASGSPLNTQNFSNTSAMTPNYGKGTSIYNAMELKSISPAGALDLIQMHPGDNSVPSYPVGSSDGQTTLSQAQSSPSTGVNPMVGGSVTTLADIHKPDNFDTGKTAIPSVPYTDDVKEASIVRNSASTSSNLDGANGGKGYQAQQMNIPLEAHTDDVRQADIVSNGEGLQSTPAEASTMSV